MKEIVTSESLTKLRLQLFMVAGFAFGFLLGMGLATVVIILRFSSVCTD